MTRTIAVGVFVLAMLPLSAAAAGCSGADPAITSVSLADVSTAHLVNFYRVTATVTNLGTQAQSGDVLQFVDVMQYGDRLDDRGIPPLAAGQSYTISYVWKRAVEAGKGTTPLNFHIRFVSPMPPGSQDCNPGNNASGINI
jgi:subtilase family serine protease